MSCRVTLRQEAEFDIGEQFDYYEKKREGLGRDFLLCLAGWRETRSFIPGFTKNYDASP